ncbi:hypothetical protein [Elioraea tepidiphila]|jgi:uncharacterized membrane protein|uniref:DUF4870 family protein n=1 Tax=Elioraea tepidiphila TaxID=457934 RepID=UPI0003675D7E|nr:hypothetical protein [Elioraea tepidiphila]
MAGSVPRSSGALPPNDAERRARTLVLAVYILYGVGFITGLAFIVGVVIAHLKRDEAPAWLRTHFTFQIRTFWISLFWGVIGVLSAWLLVGFLFLAWGFVFVLVRTVKGFLRLNDDKPIENPESWGFG